MRFARVVTPDETIQTAIEHPGGDLEPIEGDLLTGWNPTGKRITEAKRLAPIVPAAILCIGLNYRKHAEETGARIPGYPVLFQKNPAAVQNPGDPILLPRRLRSEEVDYECELAVVIGRRCSNATRENALSFVLGYTCANDVSARDWQKDKHRSGGQWCRSKGFDTFAPLGPALVTPDEIPDPNRLALRTTVNGRLLQDSNTSDMIFGVAEIIAFLSADATLLPGTVILTGTPEGVGMARTPPIWLQAGDTVTVEIEGIGALTNPVLEGPSA